ncbi:hypothetical protein H257_06823 [Aphanomyces astaci]|uniref:Uncharacterized protein n=1 Tax=Aphanomyces astaci TaxID=112090 RepID=W4GKM2_APHAT|nr:hypothetical protein H257_06823 [Aphanomyces astaci]ETV79559.1 hypothetical protein H257_06823 [Aphanomyces astaci]|eukprot:XP_009830495.1 hypothetical protein H257_06823 [Aphanomyces astaci]
MRLNVSSMRLQDQTASGNLYLQLRLEVEYGDAVLDEDEFHETNNLIMDKKIPFLTLDLKDSIAKDAFFVTLTAKKLHQAWEKHAVDFGLKSPTLTKLIVKMVAVYFKLL